MYFRMLFAKISALLLAMLFVSACTMGQTPPPPVDVNALQTQAFEVALTDIAVRQAQTALAQPSPTHTALPTFTSQPTFAPIGGATQPAFPGMMTNTPFPAFTPLALASATPASLATVTTRNGCNDGAYLSDNGPKDWDVLKPNTPYSVTFSIQNTGTCTWDDGYAFVLNTQFSSPQVKWERTEIVIQSADKPTPPQHSQAFTVKFTTPKTPGKYEVYWKLRDDAGQPFGPMVWIKFVIE